MPEDSLENTEQIEVQYIISTNKFIVLSILTLGLYEFWWVYKAWRFFQQKENTGINPVVRTILSIVYLIPLFNRINNYAIEKGCAKKFYAGVVFLNYLLISCMGFLPFPFLILSNFSVIFLLSPFKALNFAKRNAEDFVVIEQTSFSTRQIVLIILGSLFWLLSIYFTIHTLVSPGF